MICWLLGLRDCHLELNHVFLVCPKVRCKIVPFAFGGPVGIFCHKRDVGADPWCRVLSKDPRKLRHEIRVTSLLCAHLDILGLDRCVGVFGCCTFDWCEGKAAVVLLAMDGFVLIGIFEQGGVGGFVAVPDRGESIGTSRRLREVAIDYGLDSRLWERK